MCLHLSVVFWTDLVSERSIAELRHLRSLFAAWAAVEEETVAGSLSTQQKKHWGKCHCSSEAQGYKSVQ